MAGTHGGGGGRRAIVSGINVKPLVDECLVLLIILMVSSTYIVAQSLKIQLPKSHATDGTADKPATVTLLKSGGMRWNDHDAGEEEIARELKKAADADAETNLVVSADKEVQHGRVVHLLDIAKLAGISRFAINVQAE
ncbi:MAG: Biopolymer transport protein ExbD/TolR [bacterium]|nr:Biopolymer transport protein ExbD/TolR [bacterium]